MHIHSMHTQCKQNTQATNKCKNNTHIQFLQTQKQAHTHSQQRRTGIHCGPVTPLAAWSPSVQAETAGPCCSCGPPVVASCKQTYHPIGRPTRGSRCGIQNKQITSLGGPQKGPDVVSRISKSPYWEAHRRVQMWYPEKANHLIGRPTEGSICGIQNKHITLLGGPQKGPDAVSRISISPYWEAHRRVQMWYPE